MADFMIQATAMASFVAYVAATSLRIGPSSGRFSRLYRPLWTTGCVLLFLHVGLAFHFVHSWSHSDADLRVTKQTAEMIGRPLGGGIYFNYVMMVWWTADVVRLRFRPYASASGRTEFAMHVFFIFMWFNATAIFGGSTARRLGVIGFAALTAVVLVGRAKGFAPDAMKRRP